MMRMDINENSSGQIIVATSHDLTAPPNGGIVLVKDFKGKSGWFCWKVFPLAGFNEPDLLDI